MSEVLRKLLLFIFYLKAFNTLNTCEEQTTCNECIREPSLCVWCASNEHNGTRCKQESSYPGNWCPDEFLQSPTGSITITDPLVSGGSSGKEFNFFPHKYSLKLRPGAEMNFGFSVQRADDYPVDVYFLLDISHSRRLFKPRIKFVVENVYQTIKETTNNVYLGMGMLSGQLTGQNGTTMSITFKNHLKLTKEFNDFDENLSDAAADGNSNLSGDSFGALAQAIVCKEMMGWRKASRKLVVLIANGPSNVAGHGTASGFFRPFDGKCYTANNVYTREPDMDLPSAAMINELVLQNEVTVLFLVTSEYTTFYHNLGGAVAGSEVLPLMDYGHYDNINYYDSRLMSQSIKIKLHKKIKGNINLDVGLHENVHIELYPDCRKSSNNSACTVKPGQMLNFSGAIKLDKYDGIDNFTLDIAMKGTNEMLTLGVGVIKDCDCLLEENSEFCSGRSRQCGICVCGDESHEGKYCERNNSCPSGNDDSICSGHGNCAAGTCLCNPGWSGIACNCSDSLDGCIGPDNKICNDRGRCECGSCQCDRTSKLDEQVPTPGDKYCRTAPCARSHYLQCRILRTCLVCHTLTGETCGCGDDGLVVTWSGELDGDYLNSSQWNICPDAVLDEDCHLRYVYRYTDDEYGLSVLQQNICNETKSTAVQTQSSTIKGSEDKLNSTQPEYSNDTITDTRDHNPGIKDIRTLHEESLYAIIKVYEKEVVSLMAMSTKAMERVAHLEQENQLLKSSHDCNLV